MPTTQIPDAPTPEQPANAPSRPFTEAEIAMVAEVFGRPEVQGNIAATVAVLKREHPEVDWGYQRVYKLINKQVALKAQAPSTDPAKLVPTASEVLDRAPILAPAEVAEARALAKQNKLLAEQDWSALGLTAEEGRRMVSFEKFAALPLEHLARTAHGGIARVLATLLFSFEDVSRRIEKNELPEEFDGGGNPRPAIDVERDWQKLRIGLSAEIRAIKDQLDRSTLVLAKAEALKSESKPGKKKHQGFGAAPMLVQAHPGSTVNLNANGAK